VKFGVICLAILTFVALDDIPARAKTVSVNIMSGPFRFEPATIGANPGDTVTWTNTTTAEHTISPDQDGAFPEKDPIEPKETYSITVPANLGPLPYHCNFHPMNATINVVKP
jgi:plastocyanin